MLGKYWIGVLFSVYVGIQTVSIQCHAQSVRGMNLTEIGSMVYDASPVGQSKLAAQVAVDEIKRLGANHIILNPRAIMTNPRSNDVVPVTPAADRADERSRYKRLIEYIHSQGMTVGLRPIFFVVDSNGNTPFIETLANGQKKIWWHGNIQPADPNIWFDSFRRYLESYMLIAKISKVEEFTIGAELYSMTVGIEDQWKQFPHGFPKQWNDMLRYARTKLPTGCRVMYDINFTDDSVNSGGLSITGGELERWRYRLVDLGPPSNPVALKAWENDPNQGAIWKELSSFWLGLDAVGIDMYRSLAAVNEPIPTKFSDLVKKLQVRTDEYASQMDTLLAEVEGALGESKKIHFKEIGYRSTSSGFVEPFNYANKTNDVNIPHQAAAFQAFFNSFWVAGWSWFDGVSFWDVSVDPALKGVADSGFSPVGKSETAQIVSGFYQQP